MKAMGTGLARRVPKRGLRPAGAIALGLLAALTLAACGSAAHRRPAGAAALSGALRTELSYFPAGDPVLLAVQTSPSSPAVKAANQLADSVPTLVAATAALKDKLQSIGLDYASSVRPLLGNPVMVGYAGATPTLASSGDVLLCWVTAGAAKLRALLGAAHAPQGASDGTARLYPLGSTETLAVQGATLLLGHPSAVRAALARHASRDGGFSAAEFAALTGGVSGRALITVAGDLSAVLSRPSAASARRVPWVAAIRGYSATISAAAGALTLRFALETSPAGLTAAELPLSPTASPPSIAATNAPITVGLSDPAALLGFVLAAARRSSSRRLSLLGGASEMSAARTLIAQLGRSANITSNGHALLMRAGLLSPSRARAALATLALSHRGARRLGSGFYRASAHSIVGIADGQLLVGRRTSVAALRAFATAPSTPAAGAQGPLAFRVSLGALLGVALKHPPSGIAATLLAQLGAITGWVRDSTSALTGQATLALR
jgi:hypothetical protein